MERVNLMKRNTNQRTKTTEERTTLYAVEQKAQRNEIMLPFHYNSTKAMKRAHNSLTSILLLLFPSLSSRSLFHSFSLLFNRMEQREKKEEREKRNE